MIPAKYKPRPPRASVEPAMLALLYR